MRTSNYFTVSRLFTRAAEHIEKNTNEKTGTHPTVHEAITEAAAAYGFRKEVPMRAHKLFEHLFHRDIPTPKIKTKSKAVNQTFGKNQSDSQDKYAVNNVLVNRDQRTAALYSASQVAMEHHSKWFK